VVAIKRLDAMGQAARLLVLYVDLSWRTMMALANANIL